ASDVPHHAMSWSPDDVVLFTGGAKGITAECARMFAARHRVKVALVGSSRAPAPGEDSPLARSLSRFTALGARVDYYACDLSDAAAVAALVERVRAELGPITAIVHGAGLNTPARAEA